MEPRIDTSSGQVSPSDVPDPDAPAPALRQRARLVFAALLVVDFLLVLGIWGDTFGLPGWLATVLLAVALAAALLVVVTGMEPFRRWELRFEGKAEPETVYWWHVALLVLTPLVLCIPVWHYLSDEPWRLSIGRAVGLGVYLSVFVVLGKLHPRSQTPYRRPPLYGFFVAGITAALVWSVVADRDAREALATAISWPLVHYLYFVVAARLEPRSVRQRAAAREPAGDEPT